MSDAWRHDLKYAVRSLIKTPGFTGVVVFILALGIGANTAMFSFVDAVLFRPLPVPDPDRLVRIFSYDEQDGKTWNSSYPVYTDYRDQSQSFVGIAAHSDGSTVHLSLDSYTVLRPSVSMVSGNFFNVAGTTPQLGRFFTADDDRVKGKHPVAVLSDRFWKQELQSDPAAIGKLVRINGFPFTIIGVAKPEFIGVTLEFLADLWLPLAMVDEVSPGREFGPKDVLQSRNMIWLDMTARLKPHVSIAQAEAELRTIAEHRAASQPEGEKDPSARVIAARETRIDMERLSSVSRLSWLLLAATVVVLLIACAVASGLLLVRAEQRQKEIAVRLAIGASRAQILRQLFMESWILSLLSAAGAVLLALWCVDILSASMIAEGFPIPLDSATPVWNGRVLFATLLFATITTFLFGLAPSWIASRSQLIPFLKNENFRVGRFSRVNLRNAFVIAQIAFSILLLIGAGLLLRTLWKAMEVDPGFEPRGTAVGSIDLGKQGLNRDAGKQFYQQLLQNLRATPGITDVALGKVVPVQASGMRMNTKQGISADWNVVSSSFFRTLRVPLLAGRDFQDTDVEGSELVVIINETLARKISTDGNAIGKLIEDFGMNSEPARIIGIVGDVRFRNVRELAVATVYAPLSQWYMSSMTVVARSSMAPVATANQISRAVAKQNKDLPVYNVQTMEQKIRASMVQEEILAMLLTAFGVLALLLASIGLYSLLSYLAQIRTREIGIRLAVGATRRDILRVIVSHGFALAVFGVFTGLLLSIFASRLVQSWLFAITPFDLVTYLGMTLLMIGTSFLASFIPARRAASVDPVRALRYE